MQTSEIIKERRAELGYTQQKLAFKVGCSVSNINNWEADYQSPSLELAYRIATTGLKLSASDAEVILQKLRFEKGQATNNINSSVIGKKDFVLDLKHVAGIEYPPFKSNFYLWQNFRRWFYPDIKRLEKEKDVEGLIKVLGAPRCYNLDEKLCADLTGALARIGKPAVKPIVEAIKEANQTRHYKGVSLYLSDTMPLINALVEIDKPAAIKKLINFLRQEKPYNLPYFARNALVALGKPAVKPLIDVLANCNGDALYLSIRVSKALEQLYIEFPEFVAQNLPQEYFRQAKTLSGCARIPRN